MFAIQCSSFFFFECELLLYKAISVLMLGFSRFFLMTTKQQNHKTTKPQSQSPALLSRPRLAKCVECQEAWCPTNDICPGCREKKPRKRSLSPPRQEAKKKPNLEPPRPEALPGIFNNGNTCYQNAGLQVHLGSASNLKT